MASWIALGSPCALLMKMYLSHFDLCLHSSISSLQCKIWPVWPVQPVRPPSSWPGYKNGTRTGQNSNLSQMSNHCSPHSFGDCKCSPFEFAYFVVSKWVVTAMVQRFTFPISRCSNDRQLRDFTIWLCQFLCVPMSKNWQSRPLTLPISWCPNEKKMREFTLSPNERRLQEFALDFANFSSQGAVTARVHR